jgi:polyisoprenoid-binding protein YceI
MLETQELPMKRAKFLRSRTKCLPDGFSGPCRLKGGFIFTIFKKTQLIFSMKKRLILSIASAALFFVSCQNDSKNQAQAPGTTTEAPADAQGIVTTGTASGNMAVNTSASVIEWKGTKPTGSYHAGTVKLSGGELVVHDGMVTGGKFTLDMTSISATDVTGEDKTNLEDHLKDPDFFNTAKHPTGTFEIATVEPLEGDKFGATHTVTGNLTLKGISKPIRIPAKFTYDGSKMVAETPEFAINRTEWGVTYKSGIIGTIKDKMIDDFVKLKLRIETGI